MSTKTFKDKLYHEFYSAMQDAQAAARQDTGFSPRAPYERIVAAYQADLDVKVREEGEFGIWLMTDELIQSGLVDPRLAKGLESKAKKRLTTQEAKS